MERAGGACDVAIVGGGLVGACLALGFARAARRVVVLDENDAASRASRANFGLVWVQGKGADDPGYARFTRRAAQAWRGFADELEELAGCDLRLSQPGGLTLCLSDEELRAESERAARAGAASGLAADGLLETLDRERARAMLPQIGPAVSGAVYCALDGHVDALRLFHALHVALARTGVRYAPETPVETISTRGGALRLEGPWGALEAGMLVIAAGVGSERLARQVGISLPMRASKGQIVVTERAQPFLRHPTATIRQTGEGSILVGDSDADDPDETRVDLGVAAAMAERAIAMVPALARLTAARVWAGRRVMTKDGSPIYERSSQAPGAYVAIAHSGVTLAPNHAGPVVDWMIGRGDGELLAPFSTKRFDVRAP